MLLGVAVHPITFLCGISLDEYTAVSIAIPYLLFDGHLDCFQLEAITNNMAMFP